MSIIPHGQAPRTTWNHSACTQQYDGQRPSVMAVIFPIALSLVSVAYASGQGAENEATRNIPLTVPAGVPLRLYLTKRIPKRFNAPVEAKTLSPIYAFDHEVIPAGTRVLG